MRITILFILAFLISAHLTGQTSKNIIAITAGPSMPVGSYSSVAQERSDAGYAKTGLAAALSYSRLLAAGFNLEAVAYGQVNRINTLEMEGQFQNRQFTSAAGVGGDWTFSKEKWALGSLMVGVSKDWQPGSGRLALHPRALIGLAYAKAPEISGNGKWEDDYAEMLQTKSDGFGFSYMAGLKLAYHLTSRLSLTIGADFFSTTPITFKDVLAELVVTDGLYIPGYYDLKNARSLGYYQASKGSYKQVINGMNAGIGFGVRF